MPADSFTESSSTQSVSTSGVPIPSHQGPLITPQTPPMVVLIVVVSIASMAFMGVLSLCLSLFVHVYADPSITTAVLTLTSGFGGALTAMLINTRTNQPQLAGVTIAPAAPAISQLSVPVSTTVAQEEVLSTPAPAPAAPSATP